MAPGICFAGTRGAPSCRHGAAAPRCSAGLRPKGPGGPTRSPDRHGGIMAGGHGAPGPRGSQCGLPDRGRPGGDRARARAASRPRGRHRFVAPMRKRARRPAPVTNAAGTAAREYSGEYSGKFSGARSPTRQSTSVSGSTRAPAVSRHGRPRRQVHRREAVCDGLGAKTVPPERRRNFANRRAVIQADPRFNRPRAAVSGRWTRRNRSGRRL